MGDDIMTDENKPEPKPDQLLGKLLGKQQPVATVEAAQPQEPQEPQGPTVDAATLSQAELRDLWTWGQQFRARYRSEQVIPECWIVHHSLRAELLGVKLAWDEVAAGVVPLASWHYTVDLVLGRVERRWARSCGRNQHFPDEAVVTADQWLTEALQAKQDALPMVSDGEQPAVG